MNPTNYDQVLTGLQTMNREMIVGGVKYLLHFNDPDTFQYKFRLDYSRMIRGFVAVQINLCKTGQT